MNYASILRCDIANGEGFRVSLFVSGCARGCQGCHNKEAQDPKFGRVFSEKAKQKIFKELDHEYCKGLSLLGGEPMSVLSDNRQTVISLCKEVKEKYPEKDIWMWTGYTYEELLRDDTAKEIFTYIDYLVDGPFEIDKRDVSLPFRGSSNQRILKLHPTVEDVSILRAKA